MSHRNNDNKFFISKYFISTEYQMRLLPLNHLIKDIKRGESYLRLRPDRVAMQDATAQVSSLPSYYYAPTTLATEINYK